MAGQQMKRPFFGAAVVWAAQQMAVRRLQAVVMGALLLSTTLFVMATTGFAFRSSMGSSLARTHDLGSSILKEPGTQPTSTSTSLAVPPAQPPPTSPADASLAAVASLCEHTAWNPGLWLHCHSACGPDGHALCGGLTNARNRVQTCVRLAIDAGGTGVVVPPVATRAEGDLANLDDGATTRCPDAWWDMDSLREELGRHCPRLQVRVCDTAVMGTGGEEARVLDLPYRGHFKEPTHSTGTFRALVAESLNAFLGSSSSSNETEKGPSVEDPVVVRYGDAFVAWNHSHSGEMATVRRGLFSLLRNNAGVAALGRDMVGGGDGGESRVSTTTRRPLRDGAFIGVHLRAERDAPPSWGAPAVQMERFYDAIAGILEREEREEEEEKGKDVSRVRVQAVYVSCGDPDAIEAFRRMLAPLNLTVHDKWSLAAEEEEGASDDDEYHASKEEEEDALVPKMWMDRIDALEFDQKAILDYEVLRHARYFLGHFLSTMSALLAYERTVDGGKGEADDEKGGGEGEGEDFFAAYIYPGSVKPQVDRTYEPVDMVVRGDAYTKLLVVNGPDLMDTFP